MLAFLLGSKAIVLAVATVTSLFTYSKLVNDVPAKALQAYLTLGVQVTVDAPKIMAYKFADNSTLAGLHATEQAHNLTTATPMFPPTKTYDSYLYVPVHGRELNTTLPSVSMEASQPGRHELLLLELPPPEHVGLTIPQPESLYVIKIPSVELPIENEIYIGFYCIGLVVLCCVIWRACQLQAEARARSERQIGSFWLSFANAFAVPEIDIQDRIESQIGNLQTLRYEVLSQVVHMKAPAVSIILSALDGTIASLKWHQATADLNLILGPEDEASLRILSLESEVGELSQGLDEANTKHESSDDKYQQAIFELINLRKVTKDVEEKNGHLVRQSHDAKAESDRIVKDLECRVEEHSQGLVEANSTNKVLEKKCQGLVTDNITLGVSNSDLETRNRYLAEALDGSRTDCGQLTERLTEFTAHNQELENTSQSMRSERDEALQKVGSLTAANDHLARKAESYKFQAEVSEEAETTSQEEIARLSADKSRLETSIRDSKIHHKQETEALQEKLGKATKELQDIRSQPKSNGNQATKSATKKHLEAEILKLGTSLVQTEDEKEHLLKAKEESLNRIKTLEQQLKEAEADNQAANEEIFELKKHAYEPGTEDREQEGYRASYDQDLIAEHDKGWHTTVDGESKNAGAELEKTKEEVDALVKQDEAVTSDAAPNHVAPAPFIISPTNPDKANSQELKKLLTARTNQYEEKLAANNITMKHQAAELLRLRSNHPTCGPQPPPPFHVPGHYPYRNGYPINPSIHPNGHRGVPSIVPPHRFQGSNPDAHYHNGAAFVPMIPSTGPPGIPPFTMGNATKGMNPIPRPYSRFHRGHQGTSFYSGAPPCTPGYQGPPLDPGAQPFTPGGQ